MKQKKRIKTLEKEISELKKIIKKDSITLTDENNQEQVIEISFRNGVYSTDKITTVFSDPLVISENITNQQNQ